MAIIAFKKSFYALALIPLLYFSFVFIAQHKYIENHLLDAELQRSRTMAERYQLGNKNPPYTILGGYWLLSEVHSAMVNGERNFSEEEILHFARLAKNTTVSWQESMVFNPAMIFQREDYRLKAQNTFDSYEKVLLRANEIGLHKWRADLMSIQTSSMPGTEPPSPSTDCVLIRARARQFAEETQKKLNIHCSASF